MSKPLDPEAVSPRAIKFAKEGDDTDPLVFLKAKLDEVFAAKGGRFGETSFTLIWRGDKPPRVRINDASEIRFERQDE